MSVFFQDECHLLWGDACGDVWGPKQERIELPIQNEREHQTYFGALNLATGQCLVQDYAQGNGQYTVQYLQYLSPTSHPQYPHPQYPHPPSPSPNSTRNTPHEIYPVPPAPLLIKLKQFRRICKKLRPR